MALDLFVRKQTSPQFDTGTCGVGYWIGSATGNLTPNNHHSAPIAL
jgi:hypothetical protein